MLLQCDFCVNRGCARGLANHSLFSHNLLSFANVFRLRRSSDERIFRQNTAFVGIHLSSECSFRRNASFVRMHLSSEYSFRQNTAFGGIKLSTEYSFYQNTDFVRMLITSEYSFSSEGSFRHDVASK